MDIVTIPLHDWVKHQNQKLVRRDTQIINELCRHPDVGRVLVINRPSSFPIAARAVLRRERWYTRGGPTVASSRDWRVRQMGQKLFVLDIFIPDVIQTLRLRKAWWGRSLAEPLTYRSVLAAYDAIGLREPIVWCFTPLGVPLATSLPRLAFVFDAIDDWLEHPEMGPYRDAAAAGYDAVCREADLITCVADDLRKRFEGARGAVRWIPNGIGSEFLEKVLSLPADLRTIPSPRAGYVGIIEKRLDVHLISEVARRLPHVQFCFVGPFDRRHVGRLVELPNCHFLGKRDFAAMPAYIAGFDVCIVPHVVNQFTHRQNPLKLYEYLAAGKPVVTTRIAGAELFALHVALADTAEEFVFHINRALVEDGALVEVRRLAVSSCSWTSRVEQIIRELGDTPVLGLVKK